MQNSAFEQEVLKLTNDFRRQNGLKALVIDRNLEKAADSHTKDMAEGDYFSHTGKNGSKPWDRAQQAGYESGFVGENIAAGQRSAKAVVDGWINSPGHRANMLNAQYNEIGLGHYYLANDTGSVNYGNYWTQLFGKGNLTAPTPAPKPTPTPRPTPTPAPRPTPTPIPRPTPTPNPNDRSLIRGTNRSERLIGSARNQRIFGLAGNDFIDGKAGNDSLFGNQGNDTIIGGIGNDRVDGGNENDRLYGGIGNDLLLGGAGNDQLRGGAGNDVMVGSLRNLPNERDTFTGGTGADRFVLGNQRESFYNDRNAQSIGIKDYAYITDFNRGQGDVIQLNNDHKYRLGAAPRGAAGGRGLFIDNPNGQQDELIAVIRNGGNLQINSSAFRLV